MKSLTYVKNYYKLYSLSSVTVKWHDHLVDDALTKEYIEAVMDWEKGTRIEAAMDRDEGTHIDKRI